MMKVIAKTLLESKLNGRVLTLFIEDDSNKVHCLNVSLDKLDDDVVVLKRKDESTKNQEQRAKVGSYFETKLSLKNEMLRHELDEKLKKKLFKKENE